MPTSTGFTTGEVLTASGVNTYLLKGNPNRIINGDFSVNQRGFANSGSGTLDAYGLDRWKIVSSGGATWTPQSFTPGNAISDFEPATFSRIVTSGQSGTGVYSILAQPVEDVRTFAGQQAIVSFYAKAASGTPKISLELAQVFGSGGSPSSAVNTYAGQVTLSTSWARYTISMTVPSISGKTIGTTANTSYVALQFWVSAGTDFNARTGSLGIQTNTFDIWGVQFEKGAVATPFAPRLAADELALCQRYFIRFSFGSGEPVSMGYVYNNNASSISNLPVIMRASPTLAFTGLTSGADSGGTGRGFNTGMALNAATPATIGVVHTGGFNFTNGAAVYIYGQAGGATISCSSEL